MSEPTTPQTEYARHLHDSRHALTSEQCPDCPLVRDFAIIEQQARQAALDDVRQRVKSVATPQNCYLWMLAILDRLATDSEAVG